MYIRNTTKSQQLLLFLSSSYTGLILKRSWAYFAYLEKLDAHLIINFCVIDNKAMNLLNYVYY